MSIENLIERGVIIPAPEAVIIEDIDENRIMPGVKLYPATVLRGKNTYIGRHSQIGLGGGALIENSQLGANVLFMQGTCRDSTMMDGVCIRNGAEIRDNSLLEEGVDLGHTVGLKQTVLFPNVVLGSLINFCDVLMAGGTDRKHHSEVGSCMALYNYTPQGDKFASRFGDVIRGLFLREKPIFVGGQTQIISPVRVGFGTVIAAGSKLSHDLNDNCLYSEPNKSLNASFDPLELYSPDKKIIATLDYIQNLYVLKLWYQKVRLAVFENTESFVLMNAGIVRIDAAIKEREKRLKNYADKLLQSLSLHREKNRTAQIESHLNAIKCLENRPCIKSIDYDFTPVIDTLKQALNRNNSWTEAIHSLPDDIIFSVMDYFRKISI